MVLLTTISLKLKEKERKMVKYWILMIVLLLSNAIKLTDSQYSESDLQELAVIQRHADKSLDF